MNATNEVARDCRAQGRRLAIVADPVVGSAEHTKSAIAASDACSVAIGSPSDMESTISIRHPGVVVIDQDFGGPKAGFALAETVLRTSDAAVIVIGSDFDTEVSEELRERALFLHRPVHGGQLRTSIRQAFAQAALREQPEEQHGAEAGPSVDLTHLRPRERQIVTMLLDHYRVPTIAQRLGLSSHTVRNHLKNVYRRLGIHSQQALLTRLKGTDRQ